MRHLLVLFALGLAVIPTLAHAEPHALIITNNKSLSLGRADLHYADDDGLKWRQLFEDLGTHTTLLTTLDGPTRLVSTRPELEAPTRKNLEAALAKLTARMNETAGPDTLTLVFAGHGDIAGGEGFLELEDGRLTATDLERLIAKVPAARIHLVIDACNAYFMLHPRKPGARTVTRNVDGGLLERHPHIGALLSTSAEALSWEWSEIQSGLFSHALRSGLRGGADLDRDGRVTYRELEGFLTIAHLTLPDGFKPRLFIRPPRAELDLPVATLARTRPLVLDTARHVALSDERGVRLFEGHFEAGQPLPLVLPAGPIHLSERTGHGTLRATSDTGPLGPATTEEEARARGDQRLNQLFSTPFGAGSFARWAETPPQPEVPYGVSTQDVARLGSVLAAGSRFEATSRRTSGVLLLGIGALTGGLALGAALDEDTFDLNDETVPILVSAAGLSVIVGTYTLLSSGELEDLASEYAKLELTTEVERADAVARFERRLAERAEDYREVRQITGWMSLIGGAAVTSVAIIKGLTTESFDTNDGFLLGTGLLLSGFGTWSLTGMRHNVEELWDLYQDLRELPWAPGTSTPTLAPIIAPSSSGLMLGVGATF
jgi:hypothetical protein